MFGSGNLKITDGKIKSKIYNQKNELTGYIAELTVETAISMETNWISDLVNSLDNFIIYTNAIEENPSSSIL